MPVRALIVSSIVATMSAILVGVIPFNAFAEDAPKGVNPELAERMAAEKEARKACKIEICKSFAEPQPDGPPITCDVTKTWLKDEIVNRVTGGSWVWGYGHMQCLMKLNLDRSTIAKAATEASTEAAFAEHTLTCSIEKADPAKGMAFTAKVSLKPVAKFEKGEAKSVALEPVKTEGSTAASAAVTAMMAADQVSGVVSRAVAGEINTFLYDKCKADGVEIAKQ